MSRADPGAGQAVIALVFAAVLAGESLAQDSASVPVSSPTPRSTGRIEWLPEGVRNTTLGFVAPYPGAGFVSPAAMQSGLDQKTAAANGALAFWVFERAEKAEIVLLQVVNNGTFGREESELRRFAKGMRTNTGRAQILEDTLVWNTLTREYRLSIRRPDGMFLRWRCLASGARPEPIIACVMTQAPALGALDEIRLGLRLTTPAAR